jgi:hypothetical protein
VPSHAEFALAMMTIAVFAAPTLLAVAVVALIVSAVQRQLRGKLSEHQKLPILRLQNARIVENAREREVALHASESRGWRSAPLGRLIAAQRGESASPDFCGRPSFNPRRGLFLQ